jgi:hypothetical protein
MYARVCAFAYVLLLPGLGRSVVAVRGHSKDGSYIVAGARMHLFGFASCAFVALAGTIDGFGVVAATPALLAAICATGSR